MFTSLLTFIKLNAMKNVQCCKIVGDYDNYYVISYIWYRGDGKKNYSRRYVEHSSFEYTPALFAVPEKRVYQNAKFILCLQVIQQVGNVSVQWSRKDTETSINRAEGEYRYAMPQHVRLANFVMFFQSWTNRLCKLFVWVWLHRVNIFLNWRSCHKTACQLYRCTTARARDAARTGEPVQ